MTDGKIIPVKEYQFGRTMVNGQVCELWQRKETHKLGEWNGKPNNWWVKVPYGDSFEWIPWIDCGNNRSCWEVNIKQGNRTKCKWNETSIRGTCGVEIKCNGQVVYNFGCGSDIGFAFAKAQYLIVIMSEHTFNFHDPHSEIGRKIWYKGQKAVVEGLVLDQGCLMIGYDEDDNGGFDMRNRWDEDECDVSEWHGERSVKDDVLTEDIWWFRE